MCMQYVCDHENIVVEWNMMLTNNTNWIHDDWNDAIKSDFIQIENWQLKRSWFGCLYKYNNCTHWQHLHYV